MMGTLRSMSTIKRLLTASVLYAGLVLILTWPAIKNIRHSIMGIGDTYQFIWSLWCFGEALKNHLHSIWDCPVILFPYGGNLIQQDYPLWPYFFAWNLQRFGFTLVSSYNAGLMLAFWLNACCTFILTDTVIRDYGSDGGKTGRDFLPAFVAGIAFAFSPYFFARSLGGHFGYMHAYSLPLTALCLYKAHRSNSPLWYIGTGFSLVLAVLCHPYYAIYSASYIVLFYLYNSYAIKLSLSRRAGFSSFWVTFFVVLGSIAWVFAVLLAIFVTMSGGGVYQILGKTVSLRSSANPMITWWLSWGMAFFFRYKLGVKVARKPGWTWKNLFVQWFCVAIPLIVLAPYFVRAGRLVLAGDFAAQDIGWKSGPSGAYPISALFPNVYHSIWGARRHGILTSWDFGETGCIGLGWTAMAVVFLTKAWKGIRWWRFAFLFSLVMSFGPFLRIIHQLDNGPVLPFWFFRYVPIVSGARMPIRWAALAWVGWSVMIARALQSVNSRLWRSVCLIGVLLESLVIPFSSYSSDIPPIYSIVAEDKTPGAILELPFNVNDARKSWGDTDRADPVLYYQTLHHRPIVGGCIARIPDRIFKDYQRQPVLQQLVSWQKGFSGASDMDTSLFIKWARDWRISWVVLDKRRAKGVLVARVKSLLGRPVSEYDRFVAWKIG